jgi:hypothetical protein
MLGCFRVVVFFSCSQKRSGSRDFGAVGYAVLGSSQHPFYPFAGIRLPGGMGSGGRLSSPMVSRGCGVYGQSLGHLGVISTLLGS